MQYFLLLYIQYQGENRASSQSLGTQFGRCRYDDRQGILGPSAGGESESLAVLKDELLLRQLSSYSLSALRGRKRFGY